MNFRNTYCRFPVSVFWFLVCLVSFNKLNAQVYRDDAAVWLNVSAEKEINKKIDLQLTLQNRINNNVSQYGQGTLDFGVTYKISKIFRVAANYRIRERRNLNGGYSTRHQAYIAIYARKRFGKFLVVYRNRTQAGITDFNSSEEGKNPVWYNRNKLQVKYELSKRIEAYVAQELYSPLQNLTAIGFDKSRSFVGTEYKMSKKHSLEFYFMFQQELYASRQLRRDFVYGITYNVKF